MALDKIEQIKKIGKSVQGAETLRPEVVQPPPKEVFDALMRQEATKVDASSSATTKAVPKPTLMDEVRNSNASLNVNNKGSHRELLAQLDDTINRIDQVKTKLNVGDLDLKSSLQTVMRKKLLHIDESLKSALAKVGTPEPTAAADAAASSDKIVNPIQRFLGLLTEGQSKLYSLSSAISEMSAKQEISPASVLALQIKVGMIQQQIELFTALLNKALESTKTIMNVQI